jgi:hypothetical protein
MQGPTGTAISAAWARQSFLPHVGGCGNFREQMLHSTKDSLPACRALHSHFNFSAIVLINSTFRIPDLGVKLAKANAFDREEQPKLHSAKFKNGTFAHVATFF